ncbi:MAG: hypothetical protein U9R06_01160 [Patescibacteria group bacterium]|nr:hypothetical protein [Patescibacteria group bacterium]
MAISAATAQDNFSLIQGGTGSVAEINGTINGTIIVNAAENSTAEKAMGGQISVNGHVVDFGVFQSMDARDNTNWSYSHLTIGPGTGVNGKNITMATEKTDSISAFAKAVEIIGNQASSELVSVAGGNVAYSDEYGQVINGVAEIIFLSTSQSQRAVEISSKTTARAPNARLTVSTKINKAADINPASHSSESYRVETSAALFGAANTHTSAVKIKITKGK